MYALRFFCVFIYLSGAVICVAAVSFFITFSLSKPIGLPCDIVNHDGHLNFSGVFGNDVYLVSRKESLHLATGGRHANGPFSFLMGFFKGLNPHSSLHAEFCDSSPVRLVANGIEVFKLTQEDADANNSYAQIQSMYVALGSIIAALLARIVCLRVNNRLKLQERNIYS